MAAAHEELTEVDPMHIQRWFERLSWDPVKIADERVEIAETNNIGHTAEISANWSELHPIYEAVIRRVRPEAPI